MPTILNNERIVIRIRRYSIGTSLNQKKKKKHLKLVFYKKRKKNNTSAAVHTRR